MSSIEELAAPLLLGPVWNWFLYGVLIVQFYVYSYNFPGDGDNRYIKLLVYIIFFLETVQTALSGADLYYWFSVGFGNEDQLVTPFASFFDLQILGSVVSLSVQLFFVYRIWLLSEKRARWLCVSICLLSVISALGAFTTGIISYLANLFIAFLQLEILEMTWIAANMLSNLLIASTMLYYLRRVWDRDGYLSDHVLVSIVRLTVETNLVTTFVSIVSFLIITVYPHKIFYLCPYVSNFICTNPCRAINL
jgi:hypothetical protein